MTSQIRRKRRMLPGRIGVVIIPAHDLYDLFLSLTRQEREGDGVERLRPVHGRADVVDVDLHPDLPLQHPRRRPLVLDAERQRRQHRVLQVSYLQKKREMNENPFRFSSFNEILTERKACTRSALMVLIPFPLTMMVYVSSFSVDMSELNHERFVISGEDSGVGCEVISSDTEGEIRFR